MDQYVSRTPGRLPNTRGREHLGNRYTGGTLYVDHASGFIYIKNQVSLRSGETIQGKLEFERMAAQYGVYISAYHADNHPFGSAEFQEQLKLQGQTITFSGVGAHHQNGAAERAIATVARWSRSATSL